MARITAGMNAGPGSFTDLNGWIRNQREISVADLQAAKDKGFQTDKIFSQIDGGKWYGAAATVQNVLNAIHPTPPSAQTASSPIAAAPIAGLQAAASGISAATPPATSELAASPSTPMMRATTAYGENESSQTPDAPPIQVGQQKRGPLRGLQTATPSVAASYYRGGNGLIY